MNKKRFRRQLWLPAVWISACAPSSETLYGDAPAPLRDWYLQALRAEPARAQGPLPQGPGPDRLSQSVARRLGADFRRIPNPPLVLYVFPHLGAQDTPIPGYATRFFLFDRTPIAPVR